jgi:ABC-2 type transport system permease protein
LRPVGTLFQVATREVCVEKIGRFIQGFVVLLWGAHELHFSFFSLPSLCLVFAFVGAVSLFYGIFVIQATFAFWLTDTLELLDIITYGGREVAQYPLTIFNRGFYILFTYLIPVACVVYYPVATLLQREAIPLWIGFLSPLVGLIFLYLSFQFWKLGVKHYHSTGS